MKLVLSRLVNINRFVLDRLIVRSSFLLHSVMRLNANCVRFEMILSNFPFKSHAYVIHPLAALMVAESFLGVSVMNQLFSVLTMNFTVISTTPLYLAVDANLLGYLYSADHALFVSLCSLNFLRKIFVVKSQ